MSSKSAASLSVSSFLYLSSKKIVFVIVSLKPTVFPGSGKIITLAGGSISFSGIPAICPGPVDHHLHGHGYKG